MSRLQKTDPSWKERPGRGCRGGVLWWLESRGNEDLEICEDRVLHAVTWNNSFGFNLFHRMDKLTLNNQVIL
jgi:hypothetical protein